MNYACMKSSNIRNKNGHNLKEMTIFEFKQKIHYMPFNSVSSS
jgi:hypothetical protein